LFDETRGEPNCRFFLRRFSHSLWSARSYEHRLEVYRDSFATAQE
jgi:hypothetical protein